MQISLHYPMYIGSEDEFENSRAVKAVALVAEKYAYGAINTTDHPAPSGKWRANGGHDAFDPFSMLSYIAALTDKIRLHTHILVLPYRNPFLVAKCAASTDVLSNGRLTIGIGSGYMRSEYSALGVNFETRGDAMDEALEVLRLAWSGEPVTYKGSTFEAFGTLPRPIPVQKRLPIWGGGNSVRAIQRAAKLCDGYAPFFAPPTLAKSARTETLVTFEDYKARIDILREQLALNNRTGPFDISSGLPEGGGLKSRSPVEAQRFLDVAGKMGGIGVNWMIMHLPHDSLQDYLDSVQWAGEELLPKLRAMQ